jgi:hypothetical protein
MYRHSAYCGAPLTTMVYSTCTRRYVCAKDDAESGDKQIGATKQCQHSNEVSGPFTATHLCRSCIPLSIKSHLKLIAASCNFQGIKVLVK